VFVAAGFLRIQASPAWFRSDYDVGIMGEKLSFAPDRTAVLSMDLQEWYRSSISPEPNDLIVTKSRVSAFAGTDLNLLLRANDIDTLVLFGIATSGVVLSTFIQAFDDDYRLVVIKDCCADQDALATSA
jgi:nicotinamidase-related amidase